MASTIRGAPLVPNISEARVNFSVSLVEFLIFSMVSDKPCCKVFPDAAYFTDAFDRDDKEADESTPAFSNFPIKATPSSNESPNALICGAPETTLSIKS